MKKKDGILFLVICLIIIACLGVYIAYHNKQTGVEISKACFGQQCFNIEIAQTNVERQTGLMFREGLCNNCGMLFMFEQPNIYRFWMKNTLIHLDMIWIDENKTIVYIKEYAQPCATENCESFTPDKEAKYVLEINAGLIQEYNMMLGDKVTFED